MELLCQIVEFLPPSMLKRTKMAKNICHIRLSMFTKSRKNKQAEEQESEEAEAEAEQAAAKAEDVKSALQK